MTVSELVETRLADMLATPEMWGCPEALEMQVVLLWELDDMKGCRSFQATLAAWQAHVRGLHPEAPNSYLSASVGSPKALMIEMIRFWGLRRKGAEKLYLLRDPADLHRATASDDVGVVYDVGETDLATVLQTDGSWKEFGPGIVRVFVPLRVIVEDLCVLRPYNRGLARVHWVRTAFTRIPDGLPSWLLQPGGYGMWLHTTESAP